jgi:hypothetical protein
MGDFRQLRVWKKAHELTLAVYETTATFPGEELYGLTSQIRRSCMPPTSPRDVAEIATQNWGDLPTFPWVQPANWSTYFFWRVTSSY